MDTSIQAASRKLDAAILVTAPNKQFATCFIDLPQSMAGTVFTKLLRVGDELFVETSDAECIFVPDIDPAAFEDAIDCSEHYFEVGIDSEIDDPVRYEAVFESDAITYRPGV